jgi:hypothetical protein
MTSNKNGTQFKYKIDVTPTKTVSFSASTNGSLTAEVDGAQIASGDNIEVGKDVTFTATPNTGYKVSAWYVNSTLEAGNTTNTLVVTNIQENTTVSVEFDEEPLSVNTKEKLTFSVYPNPALDVLHIEATEAVIVKIYSTGGRLVKEATTNKIDVSTLSKGTYFVEVNGVKALFVKE